MGQPHCNSQWHYWHLVTIIERKMFHRVHRHPPRINLHRRRSETRLNYQLRNHRHWTTIIRLKTVLLQVQSATEWTQRNWSPQILIPAASSLQISFSIIVKLHESVSAFDLRGSDCLWVAKSIIKSFIRDYLPTWIKFTFRERNCQSSQRWHFKI